MLQAFHSHRAYVSLQRALFLLIAIVLLVGIVPAGVALDRRLARALEERAREELALAPRLVAERRSAANDVLMMHAKELAATPGLADALARGDRALALRLVQAARGTFGESAVLVTADERSLTGATPPRPLVEATRRGEMPVAVISDSGVLRTLALAPVKRDGRWLGAAGITTMVDEAEVGTLAGLTRSTVVAVGPHGTVVASTAGEAEGAAAANFADVLRASPGVREVSWGGRRFLAAAAPLSDAATVIFLRDVARELAVLPELRKTAAVIAAVALALALAVGALFAAALARPVRALAGAADRFAAGDLAAPVVRSTVAEVNRVGQAFDAMRRTLAARLDELQTANRALADRQARLSALQAELIQRDRLAAAGRFVAQLAHEIRNPVANVRNCLELIRRRLRHDAEGVEFTDMAIDELLRMHELAEQMLDLQRPRDASIQHTDAAAVAGEVAALIRVGATGREPALAVTTSGDAHAEAAITPDALKQVLINLVQNAREAMHERGTIDIAVRREDGIVVLEVADTGPGIPPDVLPRVFDPFFTTKGAVHGVGLGLFVAEGVVRSHGGRIIASNRDDGPGARFRVELVAATRPGASQDAAAAPGRASAALNAEPRP